MIDIRLSDTREDEGLWVAERVRANYPDVALLVLSAYLEPFYAQRLLTMEQIPRAIGYDGGRIPVSAWAEATASRCAVGGG